MNIKKIKATKCVDFMALSNSIGIGGSTPMISDHPRPDSVNHSKEMINNHTVIPDNGDDQVVSNCMRSVVDRPSQIKSSTSPTHFSDDDYKTSISYPPDSPHRFYGKSILPPVLLKQHAYPVAAEHDDGWRIRSRYLHCLGMDEDDLQHHDHPKRTLTASLSHHRHGDCETTIVTTDLFSTLRRSPTYTVSLKNDHREDDDTLLKTSKWERPEDVHQSLTVYPGSRKDKNGDPQPADSTCRVSFQPSVQISEIPSHRSYSQRIKKTIWMLPHEYAESVTQNAIEFMSEGFEPDRVLEESDFVQQDGKLVHPVCQILDEPENVRLKKIYYGERPKKSTKSAPSSRKLSRAL